MGIAEQRRTGGVERRGHDQESQSWLRARATEREAAPVGIESALVELVEDDSPRQETGRLGGDAGTGRR
jgi:hypothetical protein